MNAPTEDEHAPSMAPHHIGGLKQEHPHANTTVLQPLSPNVEHLPMDISGVDTFLRGEDCFMHEPYLFMTFMKTPNDSGSILWIVL